MHEVDRAIELLQAEDALTEQFREVPFELGMNTKGRRNMPHYKDGTEAREGDVVRGKPYNTPREIVGTLISITPGADTCNCLVAFVETKERTSEEATLLREKYLPCQHVYGGRHVETVAKVDYGEVKAYTLLHRPE